MNGGRYTTSANLPVRLETSPTTLQPQRWMRPPHTAGP
ncbi:unnamed protein product [Spirodela intermedia]|uniref:Uncharacterized protein n=1 Tax=Spirodela intermedia TaxID=51605 RepID=A0A7I8JM34_SPIIN|nr:unnamed protein product [Spirodela intermedia]CAA6671227.1 unnamed protein product [Spirodela intermedia]